MSGTGHMSELESLRLQVADLQRELAERDWHLDRNLQDQPEQAGLLRTIVEGTAADTGEEFFRSLVRHLAQALNVRYAFVGEWREQAFARVRILAVWSGTDFLVPFEYDPRNTPCATVIGRQYCLYESGVQSLFPEDHLLAQLEVDSYCGMPLFDKSGKPLGLLVIMDDRPIARGPLIKDLLQIFGTRAAAELQRQQGDETLRESERHFVDAQALAHLGSSDWEIDSGVIRWSDELYRIFGHEPGSIRLTYDMFLASLYPDDHDRVLAAINDALAGKTPYNIEYRIVCPDSDVRVVHALGEVHRDATGHPLRMACTVLDITERKRAEEALRASEAKFRALAEATTDWMWEVNEQAVYTYCSPKIRDLLGYEPDEALGKTPFDFMPEEEARRVAGLFGPIAAARKPFAGMENTNRHKDGRLVVLECRGVPIIDAYGVFGGYRGFDQDITERKRGENVIREAELRYRTIFEQAGAGVAQIESSTGRFVQLNHQYCEILGLTEAEMLATTVGAVTHPDDVERDLESMTRLLSGEIPSFTMEKRYVRKDDGIVWVNLNVAPLWRSGETPVHHIAIAQDITARKQTEESLRQSEGWLRSFMMNSPSIVFFKTLDGRYLYVNREFERLFQLSAGYIIGKTDYEVFSREQADQFAVNDRRVLQEGHAIETEETASYQDGVHTSLVMKFPVCGADGSDDSVWGIGGIVTDITLRKRAEGALRLTQWAVDRGADMAFWIDHSARILYVNDATCQRLGYSRDELLAMTVPDLDPDYQLSRWTQHWDDLREEKRLRYETSHRTKSGEIFPVEIVANHVAFEGQEYNFAFSRDITDRKRAEDVLHQREHDLRTAIEERERISQDLHDGILQSLFIVGLGLEASKSVMSPKSRKTAGPILDQAIDQLNHVMHEIRSFIAGLGSNLLKGRDLPTALQHMLDSLTQHQATRVRLAIEDRAVQAVSVDQSLHLLLVIQEAVSNCIKHGHAKEATVSLKMLKHGVRLSIRDDGRGFNPEAVKGAGHGLGNMAARAQKIGGRFTVLSKVNEGARIVFDLPNEASHGRH